MDKMSIEDISAKHIQEHCQRLNDFKGISKNEFIHTNIIGDSIDLKQTN